MPVLFPLCSAAGLSTVDMCNHPAWHSLSTTTVTTTTTTTTRCVTLLQCSRLLPVPHGYCESLTMPSGCNVAPADQLFAENAISAHVNKTLLINQCSPAVATS
jgi:hypothetical protein